MAEQAGKVSVETVFIIRKTLTESEQVIYVLLQQGETVEKILIALTQIKCPHFLQPQPADLLPTYTVLIRCDRRRRLPKTVVRLEKKK